MTESRIIRGYSNLSSCLRSCQLIHNEAAPFLTISVTLNCDWNSDTWPGVPQCYEKPFEQVPVNHYLWATIIPMIRSITIAKVDLGDNGPLIFCIAPLLPQAKSLELLVVGTLGRFDVQPCHQLDSKEELHDFLHGHHSQQKSLGTQARKTMDLLGYDMVSYDEDAEDEDQVRYDGPGWKWLLDLMNKDTLPFRLCVLSIMHVGQVYYDEKSGEKLWDYATCVDVVCVLLRLPIPCKPNHMNRANSSRTR